MPSELTRLSPLRCAAIGLIGAVVLVSAPAQADDSEAGMPWPGLTTPDVAPAHPQQPFPGLGVARIELALDERSGRLRPRGLFFRAADGIEIGAIGGLDGDGFRTLLALRLEF